MKKLIFLSGLIIGLNILASAQVQVPATTPWSRGFLRATNGPQAQSIIGSGSAGITNGQTNVTLSGTITGNGAGLTNLNAAANGLATTNYVNTAIANMLTNGFPTWIVSPNGVNDTSNLQGILNLATNGGVNLKLLSGTNYFVGNLTIYNHTIFDLNGSTLNFLASSNGALINVDLAGAGTVTNYSIVNGTLFGGSTNNYLSPTLQAYKGANFGLWPYYFDGNNIPLLMSNKLGVLANVYGYGEISVRVSGFDGMGMALFNSRGNGDGYAFSIVDVSKSSIGGCFYGLYLCQGNTFDFPSPWGYQPPTGAVCDNLKLKGLHIHQCAVGIFTEPYLDASACSLSDNDIGAAILGDVTFGDCEFNHDASFSIAYSSVPNAAMVHNCRMYAAGGILDITGGQTGIKIIDSCYMGANPFNLNCTNSTSSHFEFLNNIYQGGFGVTSGAGVETNQMLSTNFVFYGNHNNTNSDGTATNYTGTFIATNGINTLGAITNAMTPTGYTNSSGVEQKALNVTGISVIFHDSASGGNFSLGTITTPTLLLFRNGDYVTGTSMAAVCILTL